MDPAAVKGNQQALPTMSPAPARFCPRSRPCSLSVCRGMRLAAHPASSRAHSCACPCQPERDPAVADQFLKGETMTVHQVKAASSELQPQQEVEQLQLAVGRLHLVHCPLEVLVCHSRVPVQPFHSVLPKFNPFLPTFFPVREGPSSPILFWQVTVLSYSAKLFCSVLISVLPSSHFCPAKLIFLSCQAPIFVLPS